MTIHLVSDHSNHFSHRKCSKNRTDSESVQMSKDDTGHQCCYCQTDDIKSNLDPGIFYLCDICQFSREKICRNDWQTTAVGKCDSKTYQKITDYKINSSVDIAEILRSYTKINFFYKKNEYFPLPSTFVILAETRVAVVFSGIRQV